VIKPNQERLTSSTSAGSSLFYVYLRCSFLRFDFHAQFAFCSPHSICLDNWLYALLFHLVCARTGGGGVSAPFGNETTFKNSYSSHCTSLFVQYLLPGKHTGHTLQSTYHRIVPPPTPVCLRHQRSVFGLSFISSHMQFIINNYYCLSSINWKDALCNQIYCK